MKSLIKLIVQILWTIPGIILGFIISTIITLIVSFKYSIDEMRYYNEWIEFFGDIWFGIIILPVTHLFDEDNKI